MPNVTGADLILSIFRKYDEVKSHKSYNGWLPL